jgi:hypothetical protein
MDASEYNSQSTFSWLRTLYRVCTVLKYCAWYKPPATKGYDRERDCKVNARPCTRTRQPSAAEAPRARESNALRHHKKLYGDHILGPMLWGTYVARK